MKNGNGEYNIIRVSLSLYSTLRVPAFIHPCHPLALQTISTTITSIQEARRALEHVSAVLSALLGAGPDADRVTAALDVAVSILAAMSGGSEESDVDGPPRRDGEGRRRKRRREPSPVRDSDDEVATASPVPHDEAGPSCPPPPPPPPPAPTPDSRGTTAGGGGRARGAPAGCSRHYVRAEEGGRTEVEWQPDTCIYDTTVGSQRQGRMLRLCQRESLLFAKRIHEIILATTTDPLPRLKRLLHECAECSAVELNPSEREFPEKLHEKLSVIMAEQRRVAVYAQHHIGRLLTEIQRAHPSHTISEIQAAVCNHASAQKAAYYRRIMGECADDGCNECSAAREATGGGTSGRPTTCELTQRICRLNEGEYVNFTMTFFTQCRELAEFPPFSPLLWSCDAQGQFRELVSEARKLSDGLVEQGLPRLLTAKVPAFSLKAGAQAIEAIQYSDGDGGYIVSEFFPGIREYLQEQDIAVPTLHLAVHGYNLIKFREVHHDAPELGHVYRVEYHPRSEEEQPTAFTAEYGYKALVAARRNLSRALRLWIVPGTLDRYAEFNCVYVYVQCTGMSSTRCPFSP